MVKKPTYEELEQRIKELEIKSVREQAEKTLGESDLKLKEKAMRESEERYRTLTERTSDWIWEVDRNGIYTYSSPKVKDLLGYDTDEVVGKTFDRIREIQPEIPVMLSSGYAVNGQAGKIMRRGCNGFIQKPFNIFEFSKQVRKILDEAKKLIQQ